MHSKVLKMISCGCWGQEEWFYVMSKVNVCKKSLSCSLIFFFFFFVTLNDFFYIYFRDECEDAFSFRINIFRESNLGLVEGLSLPLRDVRNEGAQLYRTSACRTILFPVPMR